MLTALWVFLCRAGIWLYVAGRVYQLKSYVYRWCFEGAYANYPVKPHLSLEELAQTLRTLVWVADDWRHLWDAFSYPGAVQARIDKGDRRIGDCDEFAIYIASVIAMRTFEGVGNPRILTVTWRSANGSLGGHNVCLLDFPGAHASEAVGFMDYTMPRRFHNVEGCVAGVLRAYGGPGATSLGWSITDWTSLTPLEIHWA